MTTSDLAAAECRQHASRIGTMRMFLSFGAIGFLRRLAVAVAITGFGWSAAAQAQSMEKACVDYVLASTWANDKTVLSVQQVSAAQTAKFSGYYGGFSPYKSHVNINTSGLTSFLIRLRVVSLMTGVFYNLCVTEGKAVLGLCLFDENGQNGQLDDFRCPARLLARAFVPSAAPAAAAPAGAAVAPKQTVAEKTGAKSAVPKDSAARCIGNRLTYANYNDCVALGGSNTPGYCSSICK